MERFNFTKGALADLPTTGKRYHVYDSQVPGLALRVEASGSKSFYFIQREGRRVYQGKIGSFPAMTYQRARDEAIKMNAAARSGEDPVAAARRPRNERTFGELFAWWLEAYATPRRGSVKEDEAVFERYLGRIKALPLSHVTKTELRLLHGQLGSKHGHRTANKALELVRAVFNQAIKNDLWAGANPVLGVEMFEQQSRDRRLLPGEIEAFFKAVEACPHEFIRDYIYLSLYTGQRQGNVLAMRWDQLDLKSGIWHIPVTKNGRPQVVPLLEAELAILERRDQANKSKRKAERSEWVFPSPRQSATGHMMEPKKSFKAITDAAGLKDLRIHDLRRSLGSFMVDTGASLPVIGSALGHQSHAATAVYARLSLDPVREAKARALEAMKQAKKGS